MTLPSQSGTDEAAVAETMRAMFAAATRDDEASLKQIFADDFYAFDGGGRFDGMELAWPDQECPRRRQALRVDRQRTRYPGSRASWAWIAYLNRGSITDAAGTTPMTWLESAVLNYDGHRWRIRFFHSTRAKLAGRKCPKLKPSMRAQRSNPAFGVAAPDCFAALGRNYQSGAGRRQPVWNSQ